MRIKFLVTATTGSLITNLKILRRYLNALFSHLTVKKLLNIIKVEWAYFRQKTVVNGYPYILKIESTNICNLRCPFCLDRDRSAYKKGRGFGRMSLENFKRIVDILGPYTVRINLYGSGEPVLFPEIYEMISYAAKRNMAVAISANLSHFNPKNIDQLLTCGLEHLIISCHGATAESYLKYNVGGNFEKVMENMRLLLQRRRELGLKRPFIDWQFLLFSHNQHEVPLAKRLGKEMGIDLIRFVLPNIPPEFKEAWRPRPGGVPPEKKDRENEETKEARPVDPKKIKIRIHRCSWVYRSIFFNWDGGILPCCHDQIETKHDLGNMESLEQFEEMWNGERYRQARKLTNFVLNPFEAPIPSSCANCVMPQTPFMVYEKGFPLPGRILKKIKPLVKEEARSRQGDTD